MDFFDSSSAENGTFIINGGAVSSGNKAIITFNDNTMAANATFTNYGGTVDQAVGGFLAFSGQSSAGNATITNNAGSVSGALGSETFFFNTATAANATLIANGSVGQGGRIRFSSFLSGPPSGGTARIEVFGNGELDISGCDPGLTTGSLEGDGLVFLGANNLTLGTNDSSTLFSGVIQDGGFSGGTGGSLTKTGRGTLSLSGNNTYTGTTTVSHGTLVVTNTTGSATGTGAVNVTRGTLAGNGTVSGSVTVGTHRGGRAFLAPAAKMHGKATFTTLSTLTLNASSTYIYTARAQGTRAQTDEVVANGIVIEDATFQFELRAHGSLQTGTAFSLISNTAATPIVGAFNNLADGAIITAGGNNFQANYEGGDGNDLTLTVVP